MSSQQLLEEFNKLIEHQARLIKDINKFLDKPKLQGDQHGQEKTEISNL